jgi:hypothetical protein
VSPDAPEHDLVEVAIREILTAADAARVDGRLATGFEDELARTFESIARDPESLERAVEAGALSARQLYRSDHERAPSSWNAQGRREGPGVLAGAARLSGAAKGISRRGVVALRRRVGPGLRSFERRTIDRAGRAAELLSTRGQVTADHARRIASSGRTSGRLARLSPSGRALPAGLGGSAGGPTSTTLGAPTTDSAVTVLEDWIVERIGRGPGGSVLHVECGDGALVRRLAEAGFEATGADAAAEASSGTITRASCVEHLGAQRRSSLGGLVLSGATERVSPASARALAHLSSTRLGEGGIAVLVSAHPDRVTDADPITSDLAVRRPMHPVTWCHLLARYGFSEITVFNPGDAGGRPGDGGVLYAIAATRA